MFPRKFMASYVQGPKKLKYCYDRLCCLNLLLALWDNFEICVRTYISATSFWPTKLVTLSKRKISLLRNEQLIQCSFCWIFFLMISLCWVVFLIHFLSSGFLYIDHVIVCSSFLSFFPQRLNSVNFSTLSLCRILNKDIIFALLESSGITPIPWISGIISEQFRDFYSWYLQCLRVDFRRHW